MRKSEGREPDELRKWPIQNAWEEVHSRHRLVARIVRIITLLPYKQTNHIRTVHEICLTLGKVVRMQGYEVRRGVCYL